MLELLLSYIRLNMVKKASLIDMNNVEDTIKKRTFHDSYTVQNQIGSGGYAVVMSGICINTNKNVAIKVFDKKHMTKDDEINITREVDILRSIDHPNIIKILDFFDEEDHYYIVLELAEGGELFDRIIERERYSEKDARDVVMILIDAIKFCHHHDIVHRDLKPENLLLQSKDEDTHIKIADFGFATRTHDRSLNQYMGSPGYLAPEVLLSKQYGKEIDLWAVGVITFILLCGYPPFGEDSDDEVIRADFTFIEKYWKNVSEDAKDFIKSLLVVDPEKRLTAAAAVEHKWLKIEDEHISRNTLDSTLEELRHYQSVRKLRIAVHVGVAVKKMKHKLLDHLHHHSHDDDNDNNTEKRKNSETIIEESKTDDGSSKKRKL